MESPGRRDRDEEPLGDVRALLSPVILNSMADEFEDTYTEARGVTFA